MGIEVDTKNNEGQTRHDILRVGAAATLLTFLGACAPEANGGSNNLSPVAPTAENGPGVITENLVTSGKYVEVADLASHDSIVNSLPSNRPEARGGNETIHTFKISAGNRDFNFAMYDISEADSRNQPGVKLTDKDGSEIIVLQTKALYSEFFGYDGKSTWERLVLVTIPQVGVDGKPTGETAVTWLYNHEGFPGKEDEKPIDLTRPVLGYYVPLESDSTLSFWPLGSDPELLVKFDGTNPVTVSAEKDLPSGLKVLASILPSANIGVPVSAVSTASVESTPTPQPEATHESLPGIDTPVRLDEAKVIFKEASISNTYISVADGKVYPTTDSYQFLILEGKFLGNIQSFFAEGGTYKKPGWQFYLEGGEWPHYGSISSYNYDKYAVSFGFLIKVGDEGPFILHNEVEGWEVDLSPLLDKAPSPTNSSNKGQN